MRVLSASQLLTVWEQGQRQNSTERSLALLSAAYPENTRDELGALSIGRRDTRLLEFRQRLFNRALDGYAECPHCATHLQYSIASDQLFAGATETVDEPLLLTAEGFSIRLRLPNSIDLISVQDSADIEAISRGLVQRCVLEVTRSGATVATQDLPESVISGISAYLVESDPQAEFLIDLDCPACGSQWQLILDIASYLWTELDVLAKRLLKEVAMLARAYGWREADILAMSAVRRGQYLEMIA